MRLTRRWPVPAGRAAARARTGTAGAGTTLVLTLAVAALGGCTAGGTGGSTASDAKSAAAGGSAAPTAPPGKYQTLPQPCTALDLDLLRKLVPGAEDYAGAESLTYDTDRRVGCSWHGTTDQRVGSSLSIDIERVMSYDPAISDEAQAELDFDQRATAASISLVPVTATSTPTTPSTPNSGTPSAGATGSAAPPAGAGTATPPGAPVGTSGGSGTGTGAGGGTGGASAGGGSNATDTDPSLAPRLLTGVGDRAFIDDALKTPAAGPRRTVTVVFRTANVVASVTYTVSEPRGAQPAQSADMQKSAKQAAQQLEHRVER